MLLLRHKEGDPVVEVDKEEHSLHSSGVWMLLYLVKHSRPDLANPVRELSKVLDGPTPVATKELKRVTKFVLDTKDCGLKIRPGKLTDGKSELLELSLHR